MSTSSSSSSSVSKSSSVSSLPELITDDAPLECHKANYELAFELFYMYCQLESSAAAHFAEIAAEAIDCAAGIGFVPVSEDTIVNAVCHQLKSQHYLTGVWDEHLPASVRAQLVDSNNIGSENLVLDNWMHREWETAPGPAYAPNFEQAYAFFYLELKLSAKAAAHFAQLVASSYSDAMRLPKDEPACGLCSLLVEEFSETHAWDTYLPADVLQELEEECSIDTDYYAVLIDWLALADDNNNVYKGPEYENNYEVAFEQFFNTSGLSSTQAAHFAELVADEYPGDIELSATQAYVWLIDCLLDNHDDDDINGKWDAALPKSVQKQLNACEKTDEAGRAAVLHEWLNADGADSESSDSDSDSDEDEGDEPTPAAVTHQAAEELTASIYAVAWSVLIGGLAVAYSNIAPAGYCY